jgi:hypothetical protein
LAADRRPWLVLASGLPGDFVASVLMQSTCEPVTYGTEAVRKTDMTSK